MAKKPSRPPSRRPEPLPPAPSPVPCESFINPETGAQTWQPLESAGVVSVPLARYTEYLAAYGLRRTGQRYTETGNLFIFVEAVCGS